MIFEHFVCDKNTSAIISNVSCIAKRISHQNLNVDISLHLNEMVKEIQMHVETFYRFNGIEYKKFPIHVWEDVCAWFSNRNKTGWLNERKYFFLELVFGKIFDYTNFNHPCPYDGDIYISARNLSFDRIFGIEQFLPAGRYRINFSATGTDRNDVKLSGKIYFAVSDHRIERF